MTNAAKLHARDRNWRVRTYGRDNCAFIAPRLSVPKTKCEKAVREIAFQLFGFEKAVTVHIYDVVAAMEAAYEAGKKEKK